MNRPEYRWMKPDEPFPPESKVCNQCGDEKPIEEFHRIKDNRDGRANKCKACEKINRLTKSRTTC